MHPAQIQAAIKMCGYTQSRIAAELKNRNGEPMTQTTVWQVIHGRARCKDVEEKIAQITGFSEAKLWPQWHDPAAVKNRGMNAAQIAEAFRAAAA